MASPLKKYRDFFAMYLPGIHEDRLRIPSDFVEHFNGSLPEKAILKDSFGRVWPVEIGQVARSMFFANGWQQFLSEKSVQEGDFFVFHYAGNSIFDVKLLGRDQCEKEGTEEKDVKEAEREAVDEMVEEEEDDDEAEEEEEEEEDYEAEEEEGETEDDETEEEDEEEWEKGDDGAEEEEVDAFSHRSSTRGTHPTIERENCYGCKQSAARTGALFNKNAASSSLAMPNPAHPLRSYFPENPFFIAKISTLRKHRVHVPSYVLKDHNIILPPKITLIDPRGRSWIVKVGVWKDGRKSIGCRAFYKLNHLSPNDDCVFEFVRESSDQEYHIVIHICRGTA